MRQLALPVRLRASSVFESFYRGPNHIAVEQLLKATADPGTRVIWLHGPTSVGKTHLLQALCARATEHQQSATYFPLRDMAVQSAELLSGYETLNIICLDDFDAIVAKPDWERAIFRLYTELEDQNGHLAIAASAPPVNMNIGLRDLASRVAAGTILRLQPLSDEDQISAMQLRASQRGMELPLETAQFLIRRLPRDMTSLCGVLDALDEASLVNQRRLTVPFVRSALDAAQNANHQKKN